MSERVVLRRFNYRHEAEVVKSVLEGDGIDALVTSDDCGSVDPALGLVRGACVVVTSDDAARAEELLAQVGPPLDEDVEVGGDKSR
jgi:hypothetical protein